MDFIDTFNEHLIIMGADLVRYLPFIIITLPVIIFVSYITGLVVEHFYMKWAWSKISNKNKENEEKINDSSNGN